MEYKYNDGNKTGKVLIFVRATNTKSQTGHTRATSIPPFGDSFMYVDTIGDITRSECVFVGLQQTDVLQISYITFSFEKVSKPTRIFRSKGLF